MQGPRIIIDGPFGAPAQEHAKFNQVLLIGMGIGITPMLSIMRDTLHQLVKLPTGASGLEVTHSSKHKPQYSQDHQSLCHKHVGGWSGNLCIARPNPKCSVHGVCLFLKKKQCVARVRHSQLQHEV